MGNETSVPKELLTEGRYTDEAADKLLTHMRSTGRYVVLRRPRASSSSSSSSSSLSSPGASDGASAAAEASEPEYDEVHLVGVVPGSQQSAQEVAHVVRAVKPSTVYVDVPAYDLPALEAEAASTARWRPSETLPTFSGAWKGSFMLSVVRHKTRVDKDFFRMCGLDMDGSWRAAVAGARSVRARVLGIPVEEDEAYEDTDAAHIRLGWITPSPARDLFAPVETVNLNLVVYPTETTLLAEKVELPKSGFFTTDFLAEFRAQTNRKLDLVLEANTMETLDVEAVLNRDLATHLALANAGAKDAEGAAAAEHAAASANTAASGEAKATETPAPAPAVDATLSAVLASGLSAQRDSFDKQARVAVYQMRTEGKGKTVGVVELSRLGGIARRWDEPLEPAVAFPPQSLSSKALVYGVPGALTGVAGYGYYRLVSRFRKTGIVVGVLVGAAAVGTFQAFRNQAETTIGSAMWTALAKPVAPLGANLGSIRTR